MNGENPKPIDVWGVHVTLDMASQIRQWRVDQDRTWRGVAAAASRAWGLTFGSNQLFGEELCNAAAKLLGENQNEEPWN